MKSAGGSGRAQRGPLTSLLEPPSWWAPAYITAWGPCYVLQAQAQAQVQPDLQEPLASIEPLQDGPVEHGGGPSGKLRERLLHVGGSSQGSIMHEERHTIQAVGRSCHHYPARALTCPALTHTSPLLQGLGSLPFPGLWAPYP